MTLIVTRTALRPTGNTILHEIVQDLSEACWRDGRRYPLSVLAIAHPLHLLAFHL